MPKPQTVCIVGRQNAGKTTLLESLVACWSQQGLCVAVLKHDGHADVRTNTEVPGAPGADRRRDDWEKDNSDTARYAAAGADATWVAGGGQSLLRFVRDLQVEELDQMAARLTRSLADVGQAPDVIAAEGWKHCGWPKVAVIRSVEDVDWLDTQRLANLRAVFCDARLDRVAAVPQQVYHRADMTRLAEDILRWK